METNKIFNELIEIGLSSEDTLEVFSKGTRDDKNLLVFKDKLSDIIFIKDHIVKKEIYHNQREKIFDFPQEKHFKRTTNLERRFKETKSFFYNKSVIDFGCGIGDFLCKINPHTKECFGIELGNNERSLLKRKGIKVFQTFDGIPCDSIDTIFAFHVMEHLPSQIEFLKKAFEKLKKGGEIYIEVPHARDFLISKLKNQAFIKNTLWSQHLILHTSESLRRFLKICQFKNITIKGVQRYSLSNHLYWLKNNKPSGHVNEFSFLDSESLSNCYEKNLSSVDLNDTLIATAVK